MIGEGEWGKGEREPISEEVSVFSEAGLEVLHFNS